MPLPPRQPFHRRKLRPLPAPERDSDIHLRWTLELCEAKAG